MTTTDFGQLKASDIMQTDVRTVSASALVTEAERLLSEHRIGGAPVTDEAGHIIGVISMRDILDRYVQDPDARPGWARGFYDLATDEIAEGDYSGLEIPDSAEEIVRAVMTAQVHAVPRTATVAEVARELVELGVHRILVEDDSRYVGLISTFDILRALARH